MYNDVLLKEGIQITLEARDRAIQNQKRKIRKKIGRGQKFMVSGLGLDNLYRFIL